MQMGLPLLLAFCFFSLYNAKILSAVGINYGRLGSNLPSPFDSIALIKSVKAKAVKLYDADPEILRALSNTSLLISIMLPNDAISTVASSQSASDQWVQTNLFPFYPNARIRYLLIGNEILSDTSDTHLWYDIVPAMKRIKRSLRNYNIRKVKVGTPLAMDALQSSFPPSAGAFRADISDTVMKPLLQFLNRTNSFYFVDVYPYFAWASNPADVGIDYALLRRTNLTYADPGNGLTYTNMLDQQLDAVVAAMARVGFPNVRMVIAETGWPTASDTDQIGANIYNAATCNRNVAVRMESKPAAGTPARPGIVIPTFVFSLFNENEKAGASTERNWGLFYPNGARVYEVDLSGRRSDNDSS